MKSSREGQVTLQQVADEAGVSLATASRVLNGSPGRRVGDELRARVEEAAARLDYLPDANAQATARGRSAIVGLVLHDIADPYFSSIAAGVMDAAATHGLLVLIGSTQRLRSAERRHVAGLRAQRAQAIVLVGSRGHDAAGYEGLRKELQAFEQSGGRAVAISQPTLGIDTISPDNRAGAADLGSALVGLGYRRFGILAGPEDLVTATDRVAGFQAGTGPGVGSGAAEKVHGAFTRDGGYHAMEQLIRGGSLPECVFAVNDVMAVGAMAALREHGIRVPRDIAVAGFDDISTLRDVSPSLTTVRLPLRDLGEQAIELVSQPRSGSPRVRSVPGAVIVRDSTPRLA